MTNIVIGGLIEKDDKFLLVQEAKENCKGKWNIPAGRMEVNESVIDCLKREIKEETGCDNIPTGILEIGNKVLENDIFLSIILKFIKYYYSLIFITLLAILAQWSDILSRLVNKSKYIIPASMPHEL